MTQIYSKGYTYIFIIGVNCDFSQSESHYQFGESCKYIIHYKYSNQQHWLNLHNTGVLFLFCLFYLSQWLSCLQRVQMEIETGGMEVPLEALYPHPLSLCHP